MGFAAEYSFSHAAVVAIIVNGRFLGQVQTGAQRAAGELLKGLSGVTVARPSRNLQGISGHLWEQAILPNRLSSRDLLWSPTNSGPLAVEQQVLTLFDVVPLDHPEWLSRRFAIWYKWLLPRLAKRVRRIVTSSEFSKSRICAQTGVAESAVTVIPCGVGPEFHRRDAGEQNALRHRLGIAPDYVLALGSLEPRKNLPRLPRVWDRLAGKLGDTWLVVAGGPGAAGVFPAAGIGRVPPRTQFLGYVADADLPALYSGARLFVYPSEYEGFGIPPLEAMACGTPVLTGDRTSLPEVVGDAGRMVDPLDEEALSTALRGLLEDESERSLLRARGLARAMQFRWPAFAAQMQTLLNQLADDA